MRYFLFYFLFVIFYSQLSAQCDGFFPMTEGTSFEISHYDKKDKLNSIARYFIDFAGPSDDGYEVQIQFELFNEKKEAISENSFIVSCIGDTIYMNISDLMNPTLSNLGGNVETTLSGEGLEIPNDLAVGKTLPDANNTIAVGNDGMTLMNITISFTNRKVLTRETMTSPAGDFDCFVITCDSDVKTILSKKTTTKDWYAKGIGMVRSETYDKKGNLIGYSVLTSFEKG